jgi:UDPglucose 6-dehydrogenase
MTIGIVGYGFVGSAIAKSMGMNLDFGWGISTKIVDINPEKSTHKIDELGDCDAVFVCVPTPQGENGVCDTSILEGILENLLYFKGPIISKCTAPPTLYKKLGEKYINLVHSPEFLTAANAEQDYANGQFAIIGGSSKAFRNEAERIIRQGQRNLQYVRHCSIEEAALAKYGINTFLATKVVFMTELYLLCQQTGINYDTVANLITLDPRIGNSHMKVPGQDGFGFAGMCFPKDTSALYHLALAEGYEMEHMKNVIETNKKFRNIEVDEAKLYK